MTCPDTRIQPEPPPVRQPYAGPDDMIAGTFTADGLAAGTPAYGTAPMQQEEPPPPARAPYAGPGASFFVTGCRDCAHCSDGGRPESPDHWQCNHPSTTGTPGWCQWARSHPDFCGLGAKWFADALAGR